MTKRMVRFTGLGCDFHRRQSVSTLIWQGRPLLWLAFALALFVTNAQAQIICEGKAAGGYAAFPDVCRVNDGELVCVFYSGSGHVTMPTADWPRGGRIMAIRSSDDGRTWSKAVVVADTADDDRDPSVTRLKDGTLLMSWFALVPAKPPARKPWSGVRLYVSRSTDNGRTWSEPLRVEIAPGTSFACSSPIRELADGSLLWPLYSEGAQGTFGATVKSYDAGKTWNGLATIGKESGLHLDAETDVVALKDGRLLAALRASGKDLYRAESSDLGRTWGPVKPFGFAAHCPYFLRHSSGVILLAGRLVGPTSKDGNHTALYWSADEGQTWNGPFVIDTVGGAYPSLTELPDGQVYCVYYEEGAGSSIRGKRLQVTPQGVNAVPATTH